MSSGQKTLVMNTRERALSTDINRLQAFTARDRAQYARFFHNDKRQSFLLNPGVSSQYVGGETPLAADVYGGLMVDPQTTSLLVTPGELGCLFPDPSITADDSPYMLIDDPGVQVAGLLTFTATGGGGTRVDLVECQPVSVTLESDSRDIFNPATGLFNPSSVPKVQAFRLQYRLRLGTPGGGMPALAAGWLPLAVAVVTNAAADFTTVDFWDVRPLVEERTRPQSGASGHYPVTTLSGATFGSAGETLLSGFSLASYNGYLAGGSLRTSTPSPGLFGGTGNDDGDCPSLNLSLAGNQATGFAHAVQQLNAVVACFPGGLPRWVRYSQTTVGGGFGRIPRAPRGILVLAVIPDSTTTAGGFMQPVIPVFGSSPGVILYVTNSNTAGSDFAPTTANAGWIYTNDPISIPATSLPSSTSARWSLNPTALKYPPQAKILRVIAEVGYTSSSANMDRLQFFLQSITTHAPRAMLAEFNIVAPSASTWLFSATFDIPVVGSGLSTAQPSVEVVASQPASTFPLSVSLPDSTLKIIGWKISDE